MSERPDIEKTTISVRTVVLVAIGFVSVCFAIMSGGVTATWWCATQLAHINATLDQHSAAFLTLNSKTDEISNRQDEIKVYVADQIEARSKQVRPSRWTLQMQQEYDRELGDHLADPGRYAWPDPQKIHDELIGSAP